MASKKFNIGIAGYRLDADRDGIPNHHGIYFVYVCTYNQDEDIVIIHKLVYIGESDKIKDRIIKHEKHPRWLKHVRNDQTLCYSWAITENEYRDRIAAAYIFKHKPPENDEFKDSFPFDETTISSIGRTQKLNTNFTVYWTE